jgi:hypothetical protein
MSRLTRYSFRPGMYGNSMVVSERGPWVHADDAEAAVEAERNRIIELVEARRATAGLPDYKRHYNYAIDDILAAIKGEV